jgi:tellurite resistance protein TerC
VEGPLFWIVFNACILALLALDLYVLRRGPRPIRFKEALAQSVAWIALAAGFGALVYFWRGPQKTLEFATGYLIEESLSVDNLFVFLLLFNYFRVEPQYQRKVLSWGIVGALIMRGIFIVVGVGLVQRFHWIIYAFGVFLLFTGAKLLRSEEKDIDPERGVVLRLVRRWLPITPEFVGGRFFVEREGRRWATPLLVVLLIVETTDVLFAVDSIPAVLAISKDPFIVYTSNVFAILGLRALYFALAGMLELFHYLHYGLAVILMFIGAKMLASHWYELPTSIALGVVAVVLALSVAASLIWKPQTEEKT